MTIEEMLAGESKNVEFKVERPKDSIKYIKSVVAFANGSGGYILFGVDDLGRVVGIPKEKIFSEIDAITTAISDSCEPVIVPDVYLQTIDEKTIIVVEINAGRQRPYYIKAKGIVDGTYIRVSGTSRLAGRELTAEMYYEDEGRSYDSVARKDLMVNNKEIQDLCIRLKQVALANCRSEVQKESIKNITKNVLISWGLLAEAPNGKFHPTNGYVALLGVFGSSFHIQCGMFKGNTRSVFVDKREYSGPLWEQIENAFQFVLRNIHLGARLEGLFRQDIYELPPDGIRELIINAVVNSSFLQNSNVQVAIFDNRLEITSPGGLMPGVSIDRMKEGFSKIRNRALAHAFVYMNLIESWGSGIPKLMQSMYEYGLQEPEFIDMDIAFRVNLFRKIDEKVGGSKNNISVNQASQGTDQASQGTDQASQGTDQASQGTDQASQGTDQANQDIDQPNFSSSKNLVEYGKEEKAIVDLVLQDPRITQQEMALNLGWTPAKVKYYIAKLRQRKLITRNGSSQKGEWKILKN
ncbi:ATP-binding protein [Succinatimonas hippei]|uniref:ATP-binding protein n=1 Tax=Succinatimonas hippei TaxID=626938 RepID=UPI0023F848C9|nr:RNA-binding domain-containing protein [Succinatimonas hippei]